MGLLWNNLRCTLRTLKNHLRFSLLTVSCLAIAIGGNVALFHLVDTALFKPLPLAEPERLVHVHTEYRSEDAEPQRSMLSSFTFFAYRQESASFEAFEGFMEQRLTLLGTDGAERIDAAKVSAGFLPNVGADLARGRHFLADEDRPGGAKVAILSHRLWQRRFGGDEDILGRALTLEGESTTVVGVLDPLVLEPELYTPLQRDPDDSSLNTRRFHEIQVLARLAGGVSVEQALRELDLISQRLAQTFPDTHRGWSAVVLPFQEGLTAELRPRLLALQLAASFVLLIAGANLATFFLMEAERRASDTAVRTVLGASRWAIAQQHLIEGLTLALLGGAVGTLMAYWVVRPLAAMSAFDLLRPLFADQRLDLRSLIVALVVSVLVGVALGLVLTLRSLGSPLWELLKSGGREAGNVRRHRLLNLFVIAEVALALILLIGAGLSLKSFENLSQADLGFDPAAAALLDLELPAYRYPEGASRTDFVDRLQTRVSGLPGVAAAGVSTSLPPLSANARYGTFNIESRPELSADGVLFARYYLTTAGYLPALGVPLIAGRYFDQRDHATAPGAIILSRNMADRYWPGESPIGRRIQRGPRPSEERPWSTIVGIVDDVRDGGVAAPLEPAYYLPYSQHAAADIALSVQMIVRASTPGRLMSALREQVREVDREVPIQHFRTLEEHVSGSISDHRLSALVSSVFSLLSVGLAVLGIYGVMSYFVAGRTRELGIRMAFGARGSDLLRWVLARGMTLMLAGALLGLAAAVALTRFLASQLYEVHPLDPGTVAGAVLTLSVIAFLACFFPARRAARADPAVSLRSE